jgi:hypothetical protein
MRLVAIATSLFLAVSFAAPASAGPDYPQGPSVSSVAPQKKRNVKLQATWEQCFAMSVNRGFNHEIEEWQQAIRDCMEGKIPLR